MKVLDEERNNVRKEHKEEMIMEYVKRWNENWENKKENSYISWEKIDKYDEYGFLCI